MTLQLGDHAYLSTKNLQLPEDLSKKLAPRFIGPYEVLEAVGPSSFRLALPDSLRRLHLVFHSSLLRRLEGPIPPLHDPVFEVDDQDIFEVDYIVDMRFHKNKKEFLVHWKHYGVYDHTWEPESNLVNAKDALALFYKS